MAGCEWEAFVVEKVFSEWAIRKGLCKWIAFGLWKWKIFEDSEERFSTKNRFCFAKKA